MADIPPFDRDAAQQFLDMLFGSAPPDRFGMLWSNPGKESFWFRVSDLDPALAYAEKHSGKRDVYVGTYLTAADLGSRSRGTEADVVALLGLHADVDLADDVAHKKADLPGSEAEGMELIAAIEAEPTLIVHSGHGLQPWWIGRAPHDTPGAEERAAVKALLASWQRSLRTLAQRRGWTMDSTQDLVRVLRLPGTVNIKDKANPVAARLLSVGPDRWEAEELRERLIPEEILQRPAARSTTSPKTAPRPSAGPLIYNPAADVPKGKFDALVSVEPKFLASWERKRGDMADPSGSGYDLSLATYACMADWSPQEIINLIIAHRRKHNDQPEKALRQDYMEKWVIKKARESVARQRAADSLEEAIQRVEMTLDDGDPEAVEEARASFISTISAFWNVPVTGLIRYQSSPPIYRLRTAKGDINLGPAESLLSQEKMRARILDVAGVVIPKMKDERFFNQIQTLVKAAVDDDIGYEATEQGTAHTWLELYLSHKPPCTLDELKQDDRGEHRFPYTDRGSVWIFGDDLRTWLATSRGEKVSSKEMGLILRSIGAKPDILPLTVNEQKTTRSVWQLPSKFVPSTRA